MDTTGGLQDIYPENVFPIAQNWASEKTLQAAGMATGNVALSYSAWIEIGAPP